MSGVIAIIPARSGSKGVPDKNIKMLGGRPLISYSIAVARSIPSIERVIVSTDSERYASIAREYGAEVPFIRPERYSGDTVGDYPVIRHALDWLYQNEAIRSELIVHLRPTSPLRDPKYIEAAINLLSKNREATALRSVHEMSESAYKAFEVDEGKLKCLCTGSFDVEAANKARQSYEKTFQANGYVDILRGAYVIENEQVHGDQVLAFLTPPIVEVDTEYDFELLTCQITRESELLKKIFGSR